MLIGEFRLRNDSPIRLETRSVEPFSDEEWGPTVDVCAFASLLFEIAVDGTATPPSGAAGGPPFPAAVPVFVSRMIEDGRLNLRAVYRSLKSLHG
jgi:hypothetical protein